MAPKKPRTDDPTDPPKSRAERKERARTKIVDDVFSDLQRQILAGEYSAGDRLPPERDLARQVGTNRNTLREAIRRLEQARLVTVRQGQGVTVADFRRTAQIDVLQPFLEHGDDPAEKARTIADLMAARTWVLEYTLHLAVERADIADVAKLSDIAQLLTRAHASGDRETLGIGYQQWMEALVDAAHSLPTRWVANPFLDLNRAFLERFPWLWVVDETFPEYLRATERAIRTGDAEAARVANRTYYDRVDKTLVAMLRQLFSQSADAASTTPTDSSPPDDSR